MTGRIARKNCSLKLKYEFDSWEHPYRQITISGYKLILLQPKCFDFFNPAKWENDRVDTVEVEIEDGDDLFFDANLGKTVVVSGSFATRNTYTIAWPQVSVDSYATCESEPKPAAVGKCE